MPIKRLPFFARKRPCLHKLPIALCIGLAALSPASSHAAEVIETHPGISLEPMYSEAVIAYNAKQPVEALKILDAVLKQKADYVQALELKALILKDMGKPAESKSTYEALIKASLPQKAAPYHFELGVIEYNAGHTEAAVPHFKASLESGFNVAASHFFLGLIAFNQSGKSGQLGEAEKHFLAVVNLDSGELKPAAHYYLGLIAFKNGYGAGGTHELIEARSTARELKGNAIADSIAKAVDTALAPYSKSQWFGNFSVIEGYNGNIASLPDLATQAQTATGQKTVQTTLVAGLGRMSSPLDRIQWMANYRGSYNINYNPDASTFQFLSHTLDVFLTAGALARTSYGVKLEGNFVLNDEGTNPGGTDGNGSYQLGKYSLTGELGPFLRTELRRGMLLNLEAYYRPQNYYTQPDVTGNGGIIRATVSLDRAETWWNPSFYTALEKNRGTGESFRYWGIDAGLSDLIRLGDKNTLTPAVSVNFNQYNESIPQRFDKIVVLHLGYVRLLTQKWTLTADAIYTINYSSQPDTYYFTQPVVSAGVGYTF
jgi:hypothetical protein